MILDKDSTKLLRGPPPSDTVLNSVYILDRSRNPIISHNGRNLVSSFTIKYNHFRPHFELKSRLGPYPARAKVETGLADLHITAAENDDLHKNEDNEICLLFALGTRISSYTKTNSYHHPKSPSERLCLDDLPTTTSAVISRMVRPVVLEFAGGKHDILTIQLAVNPPVWAAEIRDMIFSHGCIMVLVDAGLHLRALESLKAHMESGKHPYAKFCPKGPAASDRYDTTCFVANPMPHKLLGFCPSPVFKNPSEFIIEGLASIELDRHLEVKKIKAFEALPKTLILVNFRGGSLAKEYRGFITKPGSKEHALQPGEVFEFQFGTVKWSHEVASWRATVMQEGSLKKRDAVSVFVQRGRYKTSEEYSKFEPRAIDATRLSKEQLQARVNLNNGHNITVKLVDCDSAYDNIRAAYIAFPYDTRFGELLLGLRPDLLGSKDLYHHIRDQVPDPSKFMRGLNSRQLAVVEAAKSILGGLLLVQGPPGTGKTYVLLQLIAAFLGASTKTIVLIASPTNTGANDLAQGAHELLSWILEEFPEARAKKPYILRAHADKTEDDISRTQGPKPDRKKPKVGQQTQEFRHSAQNAHDDPSIDELRAAIHPRFDGIHDDRVARIDYSVGYMKLLISGVIPGSEYADSNSERFDTFRKLYEKQAQGERLTNDEEKIWTRDGDKLTSIALSNASAIVSTTATISKPTVLDAVKDKVVAVFLDESAFEREDSLMPLFSARFPLDPCFVMIGDQQQLKPLTLAGERDNAFEPQLAISFMARMIEIGMDYTMLTEQYRMVEEISEIANSLTYDHQLINSPCTKLRNRPLAEEFQSFVLGNYGFISSRLMIDLAPSSVNTVGRNGNSSKSNDFFICVTAEIIKKLLATFGGRATIGVLTPYAAQRRGYKRMEGLMREKGLQNFQQVTVDTYDKAQGRQFDIVIVDLLVGDESAGFMESENRLNVAMTRARDGLIVICSHEVIMGTHYKRLESTPYLQRLIPLFKGQTQHVPKSEEFPQTEYLKPKVAKTTWVGKHDPRFF